jgi:hypothetical protein
VKLCLDLCIHLFFFFFYFRDPFNSGLAPGWGDPLEKINADRLEREAAEEAQQAAEKSRLFPKE